MNNKTKLQEMGIKDLYYHSQYQDRSKITVCLLVKEGQLISRGVSICSPLDQFTKRKGRAVACGRAMKALVHGCCFYPIHVRLINNLALQVNSHNGIGWFKSFFKPDPTPFEVDLIGRTVSAKALVLV